MYFIKIDWNVIIRLTNNILNLILYDDIIKSKVV